jgi:hypothetical protein
MGDHKLAYDEKTTNFMFGNILLKKCALRLHREYVKQRKKPEKLTCLR